ncbi:MAG: response regulator [Thermodesulfobacteriota bacterium]|nr:response regulator [Thermodesulfobacteriota bacterium]
MSLKILTVDDSKTIRMIVKKAFRPYDCEMLEGENGVEGLAVAAREKPDLIILDITMPVMNGIEMLEKLKNESSLKDIPVIMLTAESGKENVMQIVKMGVTNYMVKPFKGEQLIERANTVVKLEPKQDKIEVDPSEKYFSIDGDVQVLVLPEKISRPVVVEVEGFLKVRIEAMSKAGTNKLILDLRKVKEVNVSLIKLIISIIQKFQSSKIYIRVVGTSGLATELKGFTETSSIPIDNSIETAKKSFST